MRIAILADTHGALDGRVAAAVAGADLLVHAGDVGVGIYDRLAALAARVVVVAGNNDPADAWPSQAVTALPGGTLAVIHGHQWPARGRHRALRARFCAARAVVCGHSHRRVLDTDATPWILNPGAAGRTRAYGGPGYIELRAGGEAWQVAPVCFPRH